MVILNGLLSFLSGIYIGICMYSKKLKIFLTSLSTTKVFHFLVAY